MALSWSSPTYLVRERLLNALPAATGYAVWLQAPAGFGKSVLAGQLAARLGWRTLWASSLLGDPKDQIARALGLPSEAPWALLIEALAQEPTLLVLEDLRGDEALSPLLRTLPALLLLASREALSYPELPKLRTEGRLVRLGASELAFTPEEAKALFAGRNDWERAYQMTGGWPLPLYLSAFTQEPPDAPALLRGLRDSLSPPAFREGLLMSVLPYLPEEMATEATFELFQKGLLRKTPEGFQLHELLKHMAQQSLAQEVRAVVRTEQTRLSPGLRAEALWRAGLHQELLAFLEEPRTLEIPVERLVAWRSLLEKGGERARLRLGEALLQSGDRSGFLLLEPLANAEDPGVALTALGHLAYYCAEPMLGKDLERAQGYLSRGLELLNQVPPELAGRFLNDAARIFFEGGEPKEAERLLERALELLPPGSPFRLAPLNNLSLLRFELYGDLLQRIRTLEEIIPSLTGVLQSNRPGSLRDLGRLYLLLGERKQAEAHFEEAAHTPGNPLASLEAQMYLAYLRASPEALERLVGRAGLWESPYLVERGRAFLALLQKDPSWVEGLEGFFAGLAGAELKKDLNALPPYPTNREERLHWHAVRYRVGREAQDLEALLHLTPQAGRILPSLLRLDELPPERPELAQAYPLQEVLVSGWQAAIRLHAREIPPLWVRVLGRFSVQGPLGEVALEGRRREVLALLLLGLSRSEVAFELWPDLDEESARNNLSVWMNRLRKSLEPWGVPTYLQNEGLVRVESDLGQLEAALEAGEAPRVLELYHEPLMPGVYLNALEERRHEFRARVRGLLLRQSEPHYLQRLLELDPLDEEALARLLELHRLRGEQARALELQRNWQRRIRKELDRSQRNPG
ncbi:helix-turn-helix domain-containing protein [Calidithermus timidus]|jgi:tetratricopeptide (TPR) repeat protein|uniref:helix-turn-helix domain-containing protein n=1 Tax=Calidithermus timidus TaxID=307124 RepID=UPI00035EA44D|nr:helix-turn-helix domain-containing protein [Calidithermus timidus]